MVQVNDGNITNADALVVAAHIIGLSEGDVYHMTYALGV